MKRNRADRRRGARKAADLLLPDKQARRNWWASLTPDEQAAYIERKNAAKAANPSQQAREAAARLELADERHCFMSDISDEDVRARMEDRSAYGKSDD